MSWRLAHSLQQLQKELDQIFPNRLKPDWTIGDAAHRSRASDHNPNPQEVVCAIDVRSTQVAGWLWDWIVTNKPERIKYAIHKSRIISSTVSPWVVRSFGGHPHDDHIHVSVGRGKDSQSTRVDLYDSRKLWGFTSNSPVKDEEMELVESLQSMLNKAGARDRDGNQLKVDGSWGPLTESTFINGLRLGGKQSTDDYALKTHKHKLLGTAE